MTGMSHKYGINILQLCEAKSDYMHNIEIYSGTHPTHKQNTAVDVTDRFCQLKNKGIDM
jgi:hypothetical protein